MNPLPAIPIGARASPGRLLSIALLEASLATLIWGSSFVFVKLGLAYVGPLTLAGLRYFTAFLILLPWLLRRRRLPGGNAGLWLKLTIIGLSAYTIGNGAFSWSLKYLPATTLSFLMSAIPLLILGASVLWLREIPTWRQVLGIVISLSGAALFFSLGLQPGEPLGIGMASIGLVAFALFGVLGREIARVGSVDTLALTTIPLGIGGAVLLLAAFLLEGLPRWSLPAAGIVLWLAAVNTALAYLLYNHALRILTAVEMNMMLNLGPFATATVAWIVLGERLTWLQLLGVAVAVGGVALVQRARRAPAPALP